MLLAALSLTSALFGTAFTFDPARDLGAVGKSYLAPSAPVMWRGSFPDGALRIFRVVGSDGEALRIRSADGWTGRVIGTDAVVVPSKADSAARGVVTEYRFEEGCLVGLVQGGKLSRFKNPEAISLSGRPPQIWKAREDFRPEELVVMFKGTDRLQLFFRNPNCTGALMAELCILAVALLLTSRPIWRLHGLLLLASFLLLMGQTKSRGALLAFGLASAVILVARGRGILRVLSRRNVIGLAAIGFAIAGMLYFGGYRERFAQKAANRQSDAGRTEALSKVPEMIACAPGGWNEPVAGMTYTMWFQDFGRTNMVKDMMNEHLTFLVMHAWPVRFAYLFGWFGVLAFLIGFIRKGGSPVPLAVWIVQGVTSALNRTYAEPTLWIIPAGGLLWALFRADWRKDRRHYLTCLSGAALLAASLLITVQIVGSCQAVRRVPRIHSNGRWVEINGANPIHWVVDEPTVLSPTFTGKELRLYYVRNPHAPALGFVRSADDLPRDARHVTMFGRSCERYIERFKSDPGMVLPRKLTFISPTVAPSEIPEEMRKRCVFRLHLGSILARYFMDDGPFPTWGRAWRGMEIYLPDWIDIALDRSEGD